MSDKPQENKKVISHLKKLVKDIPVEVLGHIDAPALCCRSGTVALVKVDRENPALKARESENS